MPRRVVIDDGKLRAFLDAQHRVITRQQALSAGVPSSTVNSWCKTGGKWQKMLPAVYLAATGTPTPEQRQVAALLYGGARSVITGSAALRFRKLRAPGPDAIDVLVPVSAKLQSTGFVRVHRTRRMPAYYKVGPLRFANVARAVADTAHWLSSLDDVRSVVADAVQRRATTIAELGLELEAGANQGSAALRTSLTEVRDGVRSVAEAHFRKCVAESDLPKPQYNVFLRAADGTDIGQADAWWDDVGVSAEIDSQEYHFYREGWLKTSAKHGRMLKYHIRPHHFAPARVRTDWPGIYEELKSSIQEGRKRTRPNVLVFRASG
jgi:hypothetical protein